VNFVQQLAEIPETRFVTCPYRERETEYKIMGEGGTLRALPFCERLVVDQVRAFYRQIQAQRS
jgi:hypothetical protein